MSKKILVVDDDPDFQRAMQIRLKAGGYEAVMAGDGISAIAVAQKEKPDAILLDLGLPGGDGFTVMGRMKANNLLSSIPIIVVSARDPLNNLDRAFKGGATAFFQKPFRNDLLLRIVGQATSRGVSPALKKVLVIDDDEDLRHGLKIRLRAANYEPVFAQDAVTAISVAQREKPDLITLDLGLPGGDGFLVLVRLKTNAALAQIPVIVLTAQDPSASEARALKEGAVAFFQKPADPAAFKAAIRKALGE